MQNYLAIILLLVFIKKSNSSEESNPDESALKCDACKIIANRFASFFKKAEIEVGNRRLKEVEYIEAAESTCDEDWNGYGVMEIGNVQRLVGKAKENELGTKGKTVFDPLWERRLQDFCDELLSEAPDEKTLYDLWKSDSTELENYFCNGEGLFQACVSSAEFGPWPGDDYDDYDDLDFVHDEF